MAYRCSECGAVFDEPEHEHGYWEDYNGVSSLFGSRTPYTFTVCPECGEAIDTEYDYFDEEEEDEEDM
jgi:DNA-directed RNA polymerase subunit RPC12/RpoP